MKKKPLLNRLFFYTDIFRYDNYVVISTGRAKSSLLAKELILYQEELTCLCW